VTFAQSDPLEKRITLQLQEESLEDVLVLLSKETDIRFSYNSQLVNPKTKVTINIQDKTIEDILPMILPPTISYKKVGEHIVFFSYPNNGITTDSCLDTVSLTKNEDMKAQIAGLMLAAATAATPIAAQDTQQTEPVQNIEIQQQTTCKPIQFTFIYPLGTGGAKAAENCYHVSLNMLGGVTGQTKGFEAGSLFNINRYGNMGVQFAGLFNVAGTRKTDMSSYNVQFSGIFNYTNKGISVVQYAGIANVGDTAYFQAAGIFNNAKESGFQGAGLFNTANKAGAQTAGLFNIAKKSAFQGAGLFNVSQESYCQLAGLFNRGEITRFQAAGLWNSAKETKCQLAGLVNVAQESYCQIAPIVNVTKKGRFQMGLINVRDTADGVSLGLINIVKKGGVLEAGIEAGEFVHTAATFRSGVKYLYSIISVGYNYTDNFWTIGSGLGTSVKLVGNLSLNIELTHATLYTKGSIRYGNNQWNNLTQFSPILNYRFAKHFKMYAGPSLNLLFQGYQHYPYWFPWAVAPPYSLYHYDNYATRREGGYVKVIDLWVGVVGGIKF